MCTSTHTDTWERLDVTTRDRIVHALEGQGVRLTPRRQAVCEAIFSCRGHICAEHILGAVVERRPDMKMNKTTVYRTLDLLLALGLITEHSCGDGPAQYEPASRGRHSHLICRRCGRLLDLNDGMAGALRDELKAAHGFRAELESYPIFGLCAACGN